jgi:hypothetical protein
VAIFRALNASSPLEEITPSLARLNPFGEGGAALSSGLLLGVFAYWGWESSVNLGEDPPQAPDARVSTWWVAAIAIVWYVGIYQVSATALFDSLTALSLLIAFYYALTGVACAVYYRRHLLESARNLLLIGVGPLVGSGLLAADPLGARHVGPGQLLQRPGLARRRPAAGDRRRHLPRRDRADALLAHARRTLLAGATRGRRS